MRELILRLRLEREITVLMSSHILPEVESICDVVGIFDHGRLIAVDTIANLRSAAGAGMNLQLLLAEPNEKAATAFRQIPGIQQVKSQGAKILIETNTEQDLRPTLIAEAINNQAKILAFGEIDHSLEDILLRLVQFENNDEPDINSRITPASLIALLKRKLNGH
jgi:ABC-2 type transport system ATP-binding protein